MFQNFPVSLQQGNVNPFYLNSLQRWGHLDNGWTQFYAVDPEYSVAESK